MTQVNANTLMLALFVALGAMLVVGLVVLPAIDQAQARSSTAEERNKGQRGSEKGRGHLPLNC
jgi:hypothetical protein